MDSPGGFGPLSVLVPHSGDGQGLRLQAAARRAPPALEVRFLLEGALSSQLRLRAAPGGELWQHTCFEAFLRRAGMPAYLEFNFALTGEWRAHSFIRYREREGDPRACAPEIVIDASENRVKLDARIPLGDRFVAGDLEVGLSAVLEAQDGTLGYWALRHPPGKPDFHHEDAFALRLHALRD